MNSGTSTQIPVQFSKIAGVITSIAGIAVLSGWAFDILFLQEVVPGGTKMVPATALCFLLAGIALRIAAEKKKDSWGGRTAAAIFAAIGLAGALKLIEYLMGANLGFDQLFFDYPTGRMSVGTAVSFLLVGVAFFLKDSRFRVFQFLMVLGEFTAWLGLSHYVFGGEGLFPLAPMAVHTASVFLILNAGMLCLRPDMGLVALLRSHSPGGVIARRLIPATLLFPIVAGWLRLKGQLAGWYGSEDGVALFTLAVIVVFGSLIWASATLLDESDAERKNAEQKNQAQLERLNLLQQITQAIGERQDMQSIFQAMIGRLEDHWPIDFCCLCLHEPGAASITVAATGPRTGGLAAKLEMTERTQIPIDENGLSQCIRGKLVYEPDIAESKFPFPRRLAAGGLRSLVVSPLLVESQVFGVLVVARREPNSFTSGECEFLRQLTEHVALASHQADLHQALKQAYDDLRQTQEAVLQQERLRALGQMASGIAHDINNAISPIALYTDSLLEREPGLSPRTRQCLEITQRAIEDVAHTVGRMREFYRKGESEIPLAPVHLNELVQQVVDLTRARWHDMPQQRGMVIDVRLKLSEELPALLGIESEIREALTNLIFNAVDAMPEGGAVTLTTEAKRGLSDAVQLEVTDTGTGMDDETRRRCLEPFFTTKGERGTGLGLAMVYGVLRRHGSDLEIESALGKGTTMRMRFPAASGAAKASIGRASAVPARMRILVVDDDPLLIRSLQDTLEGDGHAVVTADGGQAGLDKFRSAMENGSAFHTVITDLGMPYVDGRKVAAGVKAMSSATPVILLTGWGQRLVAEDDVPAHVDHVLDKPPKLGNLREALSKCSAAVHP